MDLLVGEGLGGHAIMVKRSTEPLECVDDRDGIPRRIVDPYFEIFRITRLPVLRDPIAIDIKHSTSNSFKLSGVQVASNALWLRQAVGGD
jgi:hypothetical protein